MYRGHRGPVRRQLGLSTILFCFLASHDTACAAAVLKMEGFAPGTRQLPFTMREAHAYEGRSANSCHLGMESSAPTEVAHALRSS